MPRRRKRQPPPPPPPPPAFRRSFADTSWWNTPATGVPTDPNSGAMVAAQARLCDPPRLGSPSGAWAMPWSEITSAAEGPLVTIRDKTGATVAIHVDPTTGSMTGDDAAIVWRDHATGLEVATFETVIQRTSAGLIDVTKPILCTGFARFGLSGSGIAHQSGGEATNTGHRGIPPFPMALHPLDLYIQHRLKCSLAPPADHPGPNWPMYGIESPRGGAIPEGAVLRTKTLDASNPVRAAMHTFGVIVGDTGGNASIKTVQAGTYAPGYLTALDGLTWNDWEVVTLGWRS